MIGGRMGMRSRESSTFSRPGTPRREKSDPFSDGTASMKEESGLIGSTSAMALSRRQQSHSSRRSYSDPFADPIFEEESEDHIYNNIGDRRDIKLFSPAYLPRLPSLQTPLLPTTGMQPLSAVSESPRNTLTESMISPEHGLSSFDNTSRSTSHTSLGDKHSDNHSLNARHNEVVLPRPAEPMRISDSWWARFSRTSFLDRRKSQSRVLNIRDPHPPPRLITIKESSYSLPPSRAPSHHRAESHMYGTRHAQSSSSLQTTRTADTAMIDGLATMDVVQRMVTPSHRTSVSTDWVEDHLMSSESDSPADGPPLLHPAFEGNAISQSPTEMLPVDPLFSTMPSMSQSPRNQISPGGAVASRVQAYVRRMSQELELSNPPKSLGARNTRR